MIFATVSPLLWLGSTVILLNAKYMSYIDRDMLTRVWNEMDYRIDVCRITKGGYIERL
jgi:hypothetical protein